MIRTLYLTISLLMVNALSAQDTLAPIPPDMDFWVGQWSATWEGGKGTNTITREMKGQVIHEHFSDPGNNYYGESWSVWVPHAKQWRQTWVDVSGNYIALEGGPTPEGVTLHTHMPDKDGTMYLYHMVFYNITHDAFDWMWKRSADEGRTWEVRWAIHYRHSA